jgi:hypothetical protein
MSIRKRKRHVISELGHVIRARRIFWGAIEREMELEDAAMEMLNEKLPEFAAVFQAMPRLPMGWSLL